MSVQAERAVSSSAMSGLLVPTALFAGLLSLLLLGWGIDDLARNQVAASARVQHALGVRVRSALIRADLATVASEGRGFLVDLTEDSQRRFTAAAEKGRADIEALRAMVADDKAQIEQLDIIVPLITARTDFLQKVMNLARVGDRQGMVELAQTQRGREMMDRIFAGIGQIEELETTDFRTREKAARSHEQWLIAGLVGCGIVAAASLLLALAAWTSGKREREHLAELTASVDERRRSEAALQASEARFRAMSDSSPDKMFEADATGRTIYANRVLTEYTGAKLVQLSDGAWLDFVHPDDRAHASETWSRGIAEATPVEFEYRARRHDGAYRWFLCRSVPLRDGDGQIKGWVGTSTDIDDRKRAEVVLSQNRDELERLVGERTAELSAREAELRENVARFRLITDHSSDMVSRVGPDGTVLYVSPACQRLLGFDPSELTREAFLAMVHKDDLAALTAFRARLFSGTVQRETLIYRITHRDGHLQWVETAAQSLRDAATGAPDGFVSVLRDVTERHRLEETLLHAQKMEVIGRISAGVAHDFNNILQTVIGGLELTLENMEDGAPGREFADLALSSATRGSDLTHHLLAYARKQMLQPRLIEIGPFLSDMQRLLSRTLGPHIEVRIDKRDTTPKVFIDPNQLQTALLNLALNAADAMREGGLLTITAEAAGSDEGDRLVAVRVTDNGTGMDERTLAQACEPFFSTKVDGTGLGLSMVQGFAEQSGGRLHLESEVGRGTTAVLLFRAAQGVVKPPPDPAAMPQPSRRVLVVDDEPDVLITASAFLERAGLWVVRASSGNEALAHLSGELPFDALVTDYAMPGMNGADLALEAQAVRPGLPALIITGFAEVHGLETLPPNVQVLHKPFMRDDLLKALRQVMLRSNESLTKQP